MGVGVGIDLGNDSIKAVQVRLTGRTIQILSAVRLPRRQIAENDFGEANIPKTLGREFARAGMRLGGTVGLSGRDVLLRYMITPLMPPDKLKLYVSMQMKTGSGLPRPKTAGQGGDGLPNADDEALTYDFRLLDVPTSVKDDFVIMAGAARNSYLMSLLNGLRRARVNTRGVTPAAFGLAQAWLRLRQPSAEKETVVLADIGHENIELAIIGGSSIFFARSAPGGGKKFTDAIDRLLQMGAEKAGEYKHAYASLLSPDEKFKDEREHKMQTALREGAENIAGAVRSAVMFCRTQARMPKLDYQRLIISGGGAKLPGLRTYLEKKTGRPVERLDLLSKVDWTSCDESSRRLLESAGDELATPLGLALLDADPKGFHFSLLPELVIRRRDFIGVTLFAAGAGLILLAALWLPYRAAAAFETTAAAVVNTWKTAEEDARKDAKKIEPEVEDQLKRGVELEYHRRRVRHGLSALALAFQLRNRLPKGMNITYVGPADEAPSVGSGTMTSGRTGGSVRAVSTTTYAVRGQRDRGVVSDDRFNKVLGDFFRELKRIPGVADAKLDLTEGDKKESVNAPRVSFQFRVELSPLSTPRLAGRTNAELETPELEPDLFSEDATTTTTPPRKKNAPEPTKPTSRLPTSDKPSSKPTLRPTPSSRPGEKNQLPKEDLF
jgi:Tfp pilus assembly PilM family ATPase